jgi:hypothetical protein
MTLIGEYLENPKGFIFKHGREFMQCDLPGLLAVEHELVNLQQTLEHGEEYHFHKPYHSPDYYELFRDLLYHAIFFRTIMDDGFEYQTYLVDSYTWVDETGTMVGRFQYKIYGKYRGMKNHIFFVDKEILDRDCPSYEYHAAMSSLYGIMTAEWNEEFNQ